MAMSPACCNWAGKMSSGPGDLYVLKLFIAQVMLRLLRREGLIGTSVGVWYLHRLAALPPGKCFLRSTSSDSSLDVVQVSSSFLR